MDVVTFINRLPLPTVMGEGALVRPKDLVGAKIDDIIPFTLSFLLARSLDLCFSAHIRSESLGNIDRTVSIHVILEECDEHSGRSNNGVVKSMSKIFAILTVYADAKTSCLSITEVRA